jgi:hypothetical protein
VVAAKTAASRRAVAADRDREEVFKPEVSWSAGMVVFLDEIADGAASFLG